MLATKAKEHYFCNINTALKNIALTVSLLLTLAVGKLSAQSKSLEVSKLQKRVFALNNDAQYEKSVREIVCFLNKDNLSNEDAYYGNLILSFTYKRIFDYENVMRCLNEAETIARRITINKQYYLDNIACQKAFTLFDTKDYVNAGRIMHTLKTSGYKNINGEELPMLIMQEAYLLYLDKKYQEAENKYDIAIYKMSKINPCQLPIIYGKKVSLYGAMNMEGKLLESYNKALNYADSCKINKYNLYAAEVIKNTYKKMKNFEKAYKYLKVYDSLKSNYKAAEYKFKLKALEIKYQAEKKEQDLQLKEEVITGNKRLIALLIVAIASLVLTIALYITIQRRSKLSKEKVQSLLFTRQLLNNIEIERKRIATDLHDSVNNELLLVRSALSKETQFEVETKIDRLINNVRAISRNLHPVLFEELGLKDSVENLAERIQKNHQFLLNTEIDYNSCLTSNDELQLYRIIQESISNILKYSEAEAAIVKIFHKGANLIVEVRDNGKGFNVEKTLNNKESFGLHNIVERAKAINGIAIITSNEHGTVIHLEIPATK